MHKLHTYKCDTTLSLFTDLFVFSGLEFFRQFEVSEPKQGMHFYINFLCINFTINKYKFRHYTLNAGLK